MEIKISNKAAKEYRKLDVVTKQRILTGIEGLTETPPKGDIKAMQGYSDGTRRLRIGKYRIVYKVTAGQNDDILYIMDIGSRGEIYK